MTTRAYCVELDIYMHFVISTPSCWVKNCRLQFGEEKKKEQKNPLSFPGVRAFPCEVSVLSAVEAAGAAHRAPVLFDAVLLGAATLSAAARWVEEALVVEERLFSRTPNEV